MRAGNKALDGGSILMRLVCVLSRARGGEERQRAIARYLVTLVPIQRVNVALIDGQCASEEAPHKSQMENKPPPPPGAPASAVGVVFDRKWTLMSKTIHTLRENAQISVCSYCYSTIQRPIDIGTLLVQMNLAINKIIIKLFLYLVNISYLLPVQYPYISIRYQRLHLCLCSYFFCSLKKSSQHLMS